jgi:hypothetical protein
MTNPSPSAPLDPESERAIYEHFKRLGCFDPAKETKELIESVPALRAPVASPVAPASGLNDLLVVWRDNGEALVTTRKYPDDTGVNGPQCWPKGISGYYLATHCRKPIFHPSALAALSAPSQGAESPYSGAMDCREEDGGFTIEIGGKPIFTCSRGSRALDMAPGLTLPQAQSALFALGALLLRVDERAPVPAAPAAPVDDEEESADQHMQSASNGDDLEKSFNELHAYAKRLEERLAVHPGSASTGAAGLQIGQFRLTPGQCKPGSVHIAKPDGEGGEFDAIKLEKHPEKRCGQRAEVEHGRIRHSRHLLKRVGWKRVRRGQSMVDLCNWCAGNPGRKSKPGARADHQGGTRP